MARFPLNLDDSNETNPPKLFTLPETNKSIHIVLQIDGWKM